MNALRYFEAVARLGSFAGAANELHVTHWAVGKQIRMLEDWFGVPLFERRARGVVPTDEGTTLLGDVNGAFAQLGNSVGLLRRESITRRIRGVVRVNALASFALCWLIPRLADFQALYPDVDVRLSTTSRRLRYVSDAFDVGVRSGPEDAGRPQVIDPDARPALARMQSKGFGQSSAPGRRRFAQPHMAAFDEHAHSMV